MISVILNILMILVVIILVLLATRNYEFFSTLPKHHRFYPILAWDVLMDVVFILWLVIKIVT